MSTKSNTVEIKGYTFTFDRKNLTLHWVVTGAFSLGDCCELTKDEAKDWKAAAGDVAISLPAPRL